jgi:hypothetical protein
MGVAGFAGEIGVHFAVGYLEFFHMLPAFSGFFIYILRTDCSGRGGEGLVWTMGDDDGRQSSSG